MKEIPQTHYLGSIEVAWTNEQSTYDQFFDVFRRRACLPSESALVDIPGTRRDQELIYLRPREQLPTEPPTCYLAIDDDGRPRLMCAPVEWIREAYDSVQYRVHALVLADREKAAERSARPGAA
jgi:hypothetical protein